MISAEPVILVNPGGTYADIAFAPRGAAQQLWKCRNHEIMIAGPAETGKTYACLQKLDTLAWIFPGMTGAIIRKTRATMTGSVLATFENKVLPSDTPVQKFGGEHAEWYDYPNGSRIYVGGMDKADKVLSSERDVIYVNQAEELTLDDWEKLTTRCTGRAGIMPYAQIIGDCNPGTSFHWILQRAKSGVLTVFESRHEDNPVLYTETGELTKQGKVTMGILDNLTGVRLQRLRYGRWVSAEGQVYESWDRAVHLIDPFIIPKEWTRFRAVDFGFTNPFVCHWYAVDPDGRLYLYRELYQTQLLVEDAAKEIKRLSEGEIIETTVCDHDAEDRATLEKHGVPTTAAKKAVKTGIEAVQVRLRKAGDGKPRLFIFKNALVQPDKRLLETKKPYCTEQEIEGYVWLKPADGRAAKEQPNPVDDHGMDTMRYAVMHLESPDQSYLTMISTR